jgi:hypothetical protein
MPSDAANTAHGIASRPCVQQVMKLSINKGTFLARPGQLADALFTWSMEIELVSTYTDEAGRRRLGRRTGLWAEYLS